MKTVTFILPNYSRNPVGGYKVVFEYANELVDDNFKVNIIFLNKDALLRYNLPEWCKRILINQITRKEPKWFSLDKRINKVSARGNQLSNIINNSDVVIATAAITVGTTYNLFRKKAKLVYFIQGYENWSISTKQLYKTYNMGFKKIVIAKWLKQIVDKHSKNPAIYVPNSLDTTRYQVINPISKRNKFKIGMLYHDNPVKGAKYGLKALQIVHKRYPQLKVKMFGTAPTPKNLPDWIDYTRNATQEETINIYNSISIFLCSSIEDGFGLTGLEAMSCGAALVSSKNGGVNEYANDGKNALLAPVKDARTLANHIIELIEKDNLRQELAINGEKQAQNYSFSVAYKKFKDAILN